MTKIRPAAPVKRRVSRLLTTVVVGALPAVFVMTAQPAGATTRNLGTPSPHSDQATAVNPFGHNVYVFTPSMSASTIQGDLNSVFDAEQSNQFGTQRYALLFQPGTYDVTANIGFYTSILGLGLLPDDVNITGNLSADAQWNGGNATENFWRSASNMEVTPSSGTVTWAVAQAGPFRRMDVKGNLNLYPTGGGWASGGFVADSRVSGQVSSGSQQQWMSRNSEYGSWAGGSWNMVFAGVEGAPAQSWPSPPETVVPDSPVTREEPFLYMTGAGHYRVFVPSATTDTTGPTWTAGDTAGKSLPLSAFYIAKPSDSAAQINAALAKHKDLLFTPGIYEINQTLNISKANTVVLGMGFPTLIPENGVDTMTAGGVSGVSVSGILFDAGSENSAALLTMGTAGSSSNNSSDPDTIDDDFFRIGGDHAGSATTSLVDNANNSIIDDIWAWRADHGNTGTVGWTVNPADNGLIVNGNSVMAYGLFVEHYEQDEIIWNGQDGDDIFLQNENPYDPPSQSAWMSSSTQDGYPALYIAPSVTAFQAYGLGSYSNFNQGVDIHNAMAIQAPDSPGVQIHDAIAVFLSGSGGIDSVINGTGGSVSSSDLTTTISTYPAGPEEVNQAASLCLDAASQTVFNNGGTVQIWGCWDGANQQWVRDGNELINGASGLCLDANSTGDGSNGDAVQLWACADTPNQQWVQSGGELVNQADGLCLDANAPDDGTNGDYVQLWSCAGTSNQDWVS